LWTPDTRDARRWEFAYQAEDYKRQSFVDAAEISVLEIP
jgi:hypothetical protein